VLLALASVVFLGSESLWTRNHILLSQILDFPFRRLLRLAGSRWKYSTPPPRYIVSERTRRKHRFLCCCVLSHRWSDVFAAPLRSNTRGPDCRKHHPSIVAFVRFCGIMFTKSLPSIELFKLSCMSQYFLQSLQTNAWMLFWIRPRLLSSTSSAIHYASITSPFDDKQPQVLAVPLNKP
jgi:hypothetical protein